MIWLALVGMAASGVALMMPPHDGVFRILDGILVANLAIGVALLVVLLSGGG